METAESLIRLTSSLCSKACRIAVAFRNDPTCLARLTDAKRGDCANDRFSVDYKSLADVLVQATVRHGLTAKHPSLGRQIYGEEDLTFPLPSGQGSVTLDPANRTEFESALSGCLGEMADLHKSILEIMYADAAPHDPTLDRSFEPKDQIDLQDCGIWVDPIDGTNIYVSQPAEAKLDHVTVLIGAFSLKTGLPIFGVVGCPFQSRGGIPTQHYALAQPGHTLVSPMVSTIPFVPPQPVILASRNDPGYGALERACDGTKWKLKHESGAGYKLISLLLYHGSIFVVSPSAKIYAYDICAPHSLLTAKGGGIVGFTWLKSADLTDESTLDSTLSQNQVRYKPKSDSKDSYTITDGMVAYISQELLVEFQKVAISMGL